MKIEIGGNTAKINKSAKIITMGGKKYHLSQTGAGRFAKYDIDGVGVKGYITKRYNESVYVFYKEDDHKIMFESEHLYRSVVGILGKVL